MNTEKLKNYITELCEHPIRYLANDQTFNDFSEEYLDGDTGVINIYPRYEIVNIILNSVNNDELNGDPVSQLNILRNVAKNIDPDAEYFKFIDSDNIYGATNYDILDAIINGKLDLGDEITEIVKKHWPKILADKKNFDVSVIVTKINDGLDELKNVELDNKTAKRLRRNYLMWKDEFDKEVDKIYKFHVDENKAKTKLN